MKVPCCDTRINMEFVCNSYEMLFHELRQMNMKHECVEWVFGLLLLAVFVNERDDV